MKMIRLLAALCIGASLVTVSYAGSGKDGSVRYGEKTPRGDKGAEAERLARDPNTSIERIAKAVAEAIESGESPSDVLGRVLDARDQWTDGEVEFLYKTVISTTPGLADSLPSDVRDFIEAGKPTEVSPDASEGQKVLAEIAGTNVNVDNVISSVVADSTGTTENIPVAPLRDPQPADPHPVVPTPPVVSSSN